ncbi:RagB/SusD family nutrient uptake outer membrane protein [Pedobacter sp. SYP-B3415]|uniref:RagB/SusD family nutrient uptake outer membrane protein n=1 Tax=Pedobacter sp. SYP-B3415 TaxID=2496641 RepID=UPI00101CB856|nr:RagB/SusD family nutrient uptake outer membrane protein [Pedobacter sp. SYP-B3415]
MKKSIYITLLFCTFFVGCEQDFLAVKPDQKLVVPSTVRDAQALMDNSTMNADGPYLGEVSAGDYVLTAAFWSSMTPEIRNAYTWAADIYQGGAVPDWNKAYQKVFYANLALETLEGISPVSSEQEAYNQAKGAALFHRAWNFYLLSQQFCKPYVAQTVATDLGIALRLKSDINVKSVRSSVERTYQQIIADATQGADLLADLPSFKTRPSKWACYALLAKTYLQMGEYAQAEKYANECMKINSELLDFNTLNPSANFPFSQYNKEVIFHMVMPNVSPFTSSRVDVKAELLARYETNDLRRSCYFFANAGRTAYKGSYNGSSALFCGLAVDEIVLIAAESAARLGKIEAALMHLNRLLRFRYKTGNFTPRVESNQQALLAMILLERRKELLFRGVRWGDLRRLNLEPATAVTLNASLSGETFTLLPNALRYTFALPDEVIALSGMQQNER